jgi:hypothetical protein
MTQILTIILVVSSLSLAGIFALVDGNRLARLALRGEI